MASRATHTYQLALDFDILFDNEGMAEEKQHNGAPTVFIIEGDMLSLNDETWSDADILHFVERFLMASLAVLASGYQKKESKDEVKAWLMDIDSDNPLSFSNCCVMLGYDSEELSTWTKLAIKKAEGSR